jgi:hypothetical protein
MNTRHRPTLASRLTRRWVRVYTAHLEPALRDTRRAELASDLWEHEADARRMDIGALRVNAQVLRRLLVGMPADMSWRRQQGDATPALSTTAPVPAAEQHSRWVCRVCGHHYVTKRLPNKLGDGGTYCICERCNHEKLPPGGPPAHWMSGMGP